MTFSNNEEVVLKRIQAFILSELNVKGFISSKRIYSDVHNTNYELKYRYVSAIKVLKKLELLHPKKRHRKNVLLKIHKLIPRNGKYSKNVQEQIEKLETEYK